MKGWLRKHCIHLDYWKPTAINLFVDWRGPSSCFCTHGFLLNNTLR